MSSSKLEVSPLEHHVGYWMRFVSNHVSYCFQEKLEHEGVSVAEWVMLRRLYEVEGMTPTDLTSAIGMTKGAISKLIDRLEAKGLARRSAREEDRRGQQVTITNLGRSLVPTLAQKADQNDAEFFGHLDGAQRGRLIELLKEVVVRHDLQAVPTE